MKPEQIIETLEQAAKQMGVQVRYETMTGEVSGGGGLCKVKGQWCVIIDRKVAPTERAATLTDALAQLDTDGVFLPPENPRRPYRRPRVPPRAAAHRLTSRAAPAETDRSKALQLLVVRCARFRRRRGGPGSSSAYAPKGLESGGTTEPPASAPADKLPGPARARVPPRSASPPPRPSGRPTLPPGRDLPVPAPMLRPTRPPMAADVPVECDVRAGPPLPGTRPAYGAERCSSTSEGDAGVRSAGAEAGGSVVPPADSNPSGAEADRIPASLAPPRSRAERSNPSGAEADRIPASLAPPRSRAERALERASVGAGQGRNLMFVIAASIGQAAAAASPPSAGLLDPL